MPLEGNDNELPSAEAGNQTIQIQGDNSSSELPPVGDPPLSRTAPSDNDPPSEHPSKWRENTKLGLEILGLAVLIAYTVFSCLQWLQIRWTNRLTREALNSSGEALNQSLIKMQGQINAMSRLATATETANKNVLEADRPWFGVILAAQDPIEVGKVPSATVEFLNSGKRPAQVMIAEVSDHWFNKFPKNPPYQDSKIKSSQMVVPGSVVISKFNLFKSPPPQEEIDAANSGIPARFFVYAKINYVDMRTGNRHFTHACWTYIGDDPNVTKGFYNCSIEEGYNDAD